ncbi:hypothetical protein COO60DRAFT_1461903, partial [Scenedesmus sp. NREL 46B-D3]
ALAAGRGQPLVHWLRGADNHWRFACIKAAVESARSLKFPDSAFIVNIDDFPICREGRCPLPVFTNYKKWRDGGNLDTNEVLFPVFNHHYEDLYVFPWERKRPKAFMRASQQGCMPANSSRAVLAVTSEYHPRQLDLGITRIDGSDKHFLKFSDKHFLEFRWVRRLQGLGFGCGDGEYHRRQRQLCQLDQSIMRIGGRDKHFLKFRWTRLVKVMLANSVVIKEESDWIEYYYRSLKPWQHYAPFRAGSDAGDQVIALVEHLEANDKKARAMAAEAQHWAYSRRTPASPAWASAAAALALEGSCRRRTRSSTFGSRMGDAAAAAAARAGTDKSDNVDQEANLRAILGKLGEPQQLLGEQQQQAAAVASAFAALATAAANMKCNAGVGMTAQGSPALHGQPALERELEQTHHHAADLRQERDELRELFAAYIVGNHFAVSDRIAKCAST